MAPLRRNGTQLFHNKDLVLEVGASVDRRKWDESKYEAFIDELCDVREYQKTAIRDALRYLIGGEYRDLRALAKQNFEANPVLRARYGSWDGMQRQLQLPDQLSASIDLATGTGKSFVMYGIAAIMLAEGVVDRVLVLCPSTTIEASLMDKFETLAGNSDLRDLLPSTALINAPRIINARESIVAGSICVENYHAILQHVRSSIRDSLKGKGDRTLVLNDEAHHLANESTSRTLRWKEFLTDAEFKFRYLINVSGTCYVGNDYFADVISRYSLQQAMEERFVKKVKYVAEMPQTSRPDEKWQLVLNHHTEIGRKLRPHKIRPLTIVVTPTIERCKDVVEQLKAFLIEHGGKSRTQADDQVLSIYSNAPDLARLPAVNNATNKTEWIVSVSMLNEGWDVQRVFQIVPHEERAFNSKLLIAQVLGRGLRVPKGWKGTQPEVTVFNHDSWAPRIRHLVDEVMENEKRIPSFPLEQSEFNFDLINIEYDPQPYIDEYPMKGPYKLFEKGYVGLATEKPVEDVALEFEQAATGARSRWQTSIRRKTYSTRDVAKVMYERLEDITSPKDRRHYTKQFPIARLEQIIKRSLSEAGVRVITDGIRQKFLQSLGTLQRKGAQVVRYKFQATRYETVSTASRSTETASASDLKNNKTFFYTTKTAASMPDERKEFYEEATEQGSGYKCVLVSNEYDFRTPLNAVIADHENERRFVKNLLDAQNAQHVLAWIKSTSMGFYEIDYAWKKREHPKRGKFSPDFFIKLDGAILVVEIKGDEELSEPSEENIKKFQYASEHFHRINQHLSSGKGHKEQPTYRFNFLAPSDFNRYFQSIRDGSVLTFRSGLDIKLLESA